MEGIRDFVQVLPKLIYIGIRVCHTRYVFDF